MKYIGANIEKPRSGVDVFIVTESGRRGIAQFWDLTGLWLTMDRKISQGDSVKKWKYADAENVIYTTNE